MADPISLTASPDSTGMIWTTSPPYTPPNYSGNSYTHQFAIGPSSGNNFPVSDLPPTPTVNASDNTNGSDGGSGNVLTFNAAKVTMNATANNSNGLGPGLQITIVLNYGSGKP